MLKKTLLFSLLITAGLLSASSFAATNACISDLDSRTFNNSLDVGNCNLHDADMPQLVAYLLNHPSINWLGAWNNHISQGAIALAKVPGLQQLLLYENDIGDKGAEALAKMPNLISLDLGRNNVHDQGAIALAKSTSIKVLAVSENALTDKGALAIAKAPFIELYISSNFLSYETMTAFATNINLKYLNFINTRIGDISARTLAQSTTIERLEFENSYMSNIALKALTQDRFLKYLGFDAASSTDEDSIRILATSKYLSGLGIGGGYLGDEEAKILAANTSLKMLTLNFNIIGDAGAVALASNTTLKNLDIAYNHIGDAGAIALAANTTLQQLDIGHNHISTVGLAALAKSSIPNIDTHGNADNITAHIRKIQCPEKDTFCQKSLSHI